MLRRIFMVLAGLIWVGSAYGADVSLLNVSYDPTRELYADFNKAFAAHYQKETGKSVEIKQSHGGSGKQARGVIDGLQADVVTLALAYDIDATRSTVCWQRTGRSGCRRTHRPIRRRSFFWCVRAIPKGIKDWDDLVKPGVNVITPNPKTSGGARWNYLAAWDFALKEVRQRRQGQAVRRPTYTSNVPVLDSGARGSTTPSSSAASATCCWHGRTKPFSR